MLCPWLFLPLMAACPGSSPAPEQPAPAVDQRTAELTPSVPPVEPSSIQLPTLPNLQPLQLLRLDYTFQAAELAQRDWPAMRPADTCVLLIEPQTQWVVNCPHAPASFAKVSQGFRGHPVFMHAGGTFESAGRSQSTAEFLAKTPAAAQVPARATTQALPGAQPWLVVGSLEALSEFHPAFEHATTEAWVSVVMHELVHTHQLRAPGAERFVDEVVSGKRTPDALTELFLTNKRFRALIEREYALLTRAALADPKDEQAARRALKSWLAHYQRRSTGLQGMPNAEQLIADDVLFSYIEGVARFVESQFLEEPSLQPQTSLANDPRFGQYALFRDRGYAGSPNRQLDEHYFYAIGYHLCVLLDRVDKRWRSRVHTRDQFLYDLVREVADSAK